MKEQDKELLKEQTTSSFSTMMSDVFASFVKVAQQNIVDHIKEAVDSTLKKTKETANEIIRNAVTSILLAFLGLIGFIFAISGLSLWLGEISELGPWFGFLIVGIIIIIIALIGGLMQKKKS